MLWFNGALVEGQVPFDLSDRGLLLGDGVFDTALAINGRVVFEDAHVARLLHAVTSLGFTIEQGRIVDAMRAVAAVAPRAVIRTTITRGGGARGIVPPEHPNPNLFARGSVLQPGFSFAPLTLRITEIRRNETSPSSRLKTLCYLDSVLATQTSKIAGFDDALFLNTQGNLACAGSGNIFIIRSGVLLTPPLEDGVLPGIVRQQIIDIALSSDIPVGIHSFPGSEMETAEAAFLTNSLRLLSPITRINDLTLPSQHNKVVVDLSKTLQKAMADNVSRSVT